MADFIGKYENLQTDFDYHICDQLKVDRRLLPQKEINQENENTKLYRIL